MKKVITEPHLYRSLMNVKRSSGFQNSPKLNSNTFPSILLFGIAYTRMRFIYNHYIVNNNLKPQLYYNLTTGSSNTDTSLLLFTTLLSIRHPYIQNTVNNLKWKLYHNFSNVKWQLESRNPPKLNSNTYPYPFLFQIIHTHMYTYVTSVRTTRWTILNRNSTTVLPLESSHRYLKIRLN